MHVDQTHVGFQAVFRAVTSQGAGQRFAEGDGLLSRRLKGLFVPAIDVAERGLNRHQVVHDLAREIEQQAIGGHAAADAWG